LFSRDNFKTGIMLLVLPFVVILLSLILSKPILGFKVLFFANFFALGISRYIPGPLGLSVDALLTLTWLAVVFSQFNKKVEWRRANSILTLLAFIWFSYALFQLVNPESVSKEAWFYAMRGVSMYFFLTVPLVFIIFNKPENLNWMLKFWAWFTLLAVAKGVQQFVIGVDPWEKYWLDTVGGKTHLLAQGLRVFSFFSDAASYGGSMGFSAVVFGIVGLNEKSIKKRYFWYLVSGAALFGMLISGTRGAIAVPFGGIAMYALLSKKIKLMAIGGFIVIGIYIFLRFTTVGESVYLIRRFREATDPNNPSLMVRKENQAKLSIYLSSRPFGGGIGSAGNWGLRFSPGTFLAETPTDSWYVQIWAEQGMVGLALHLFILIFIVGKSAYIIMFKLRSKEFIGKGAALTSGIVGIMLASYGSGALGQMPNGIIIYMSMTFIFMMPRWEKDEQEIANGSLIEDFRDVENPKTMH